MDPFGTVMSASVTTRVSPSTGCCKRNRGGLQLCSVQGVWRTSTSTFLGCAAGPGKCCSIRPSIRAGVRGSPAAAAQSISRDVQPPLQMLWPAPSRHASETAGRRRPRKLHSRRRRLQSSLQAASSGAHLKRTWLPSKPPRKMHASRCQLRCAERHATWHRPSFE